MEPESVELLKQARRQAVRLIDELLRHEADLRQRPSRLTPEEAAEGRAAIRHALERARRTLQCLNQLLNLVAEKNHE